MCELLAMSAQSPTNLTLSLNELVEHSAGNGPADGWGVAYYQGNDARRIRDTSAATDSPWSRFVEQQGLTSQIVIAHIRRATQGATSLNNTQPFTRELGGRLHVFAHNGDLPALLDFDNYQYQNFRPIGTSDSERVFCQLLDRLRDAWLDQKKKPSFDCRWGVFKDLCAEMRPLGPANFLYSDGEYLFAHANKRTQADGVRRPPGLNYLCRSCQPDSKISGKAVSVGGEQAVVLVASRPLSNEAWQAMAEGELLALHNGHILAQSTV